MEEVYLKPKGEYVPSKTYPFEGHPNWCQVARRSYCNHADGWQVEYDASHWLISRDEVEVGAPMISTNEAGRVAALQKYAILDSEPEQAFDDLTLLASYVCKTPIALISLIDEDRQWFKSRVGISATETSRDIAFCSTAIQQPDVFVVPDALRDERFCRNPLVISEPNIRFYAGAPLINEDGYALGTLCVIDLTPRELGTDQEAALKALSRLVLMQMEFRRNLILLKEALNDRTREEHERERELKKVQDTLVRVLRVHT